MADIAETAIPAANTETVNMETIIKEWEVAMELPLPTTWVTDTEAAMVNLVHHRAWTTTACSREDSTTKAAITTKGSHRDQMAASSSNNNPTFINNLLDCKAPQMTPPIREVLGGHLDLLEEDRTGEETGSETIRYESRLERYAMNSFPK